MYPGTLQLGRYPRAGHASILVPNAGARAAPDTRQLVALLWMESGPGLYTPLTIPFFTEPEYCDPVIIT